MDDVTHLLLEARDGDRDAFSAVVRILQSDVVRLATFLVGPAEAEDVAQDAFVRAWGALGRYRVEASGRTWLLSIARRACVDAVRGLQRRRRIQTRLDLHFDPGQRSVADSSGRVSLERLIAALDSDRREAFVLTQILGLSYQEAAVACGVAVGTIRSRVARARDHLMASVEEAAG